MLFRAITDAVQQIEQIQAEEDSVRQSLEELAAFLKHAQVEAEASIIQK